MSTSMERGTSTRLSLKKLTKRLSARNKDYSKVEDLYDTRVPLHNEDAFSHGLRFKAKFIGSLEISRPTCKVDIITAMRRIRYEFKVKGIRKVRSNIQVSTHGVKVTKRKRKRTRKHYTDEQLFIMQHPIYRIFYVSHDSQDMKIFSYITRELPDSTFRCNVFKAYKKNMALHVVRSLGQAFDVCHRLNPRPKKTKKGGETGEEGEEKAEGEEENGEVEGEDKGEQKQLANGSAEVEDLVSAVKDVSLNEGGKEKEPALQNDLIGLDFDPFSFNFETPGGQGTHQNGAPQMGFNSSFTSGGGGVPTTFPPLMVGNNPSGFPELPAGSSAAQAQLQLAGRPRPRPATGNQQNIIQENPFADPLRTESESPVLSIGEAIDGLEKMNSNPFLTGGSQAGQQPPSMWEIHKQQMMAQMALMREQLKQETASRIESQARVEHLLLQNKQLLTHVQKLMVELEKIQSLQMAQLLASGVQSPPSTQAPAVDPPPPASSLPAIPETASETEPAKIAAIISTPPSETPPPPPESTPTTEPSDTLLSQEVVLDSSSTSTTTVATDSELLPTPFDIPLLTPQQDPNEQGSPPQTSTPVAPSPELEDPREQASSSPFPDTAILPTNDPFTPQ